MFRSRILNNALISLLITNLLILNGRDDWMSRFLFPLHYLDMLVSFISVFVVFEYTDRITRYLNSKISWHKYFGKRIVLQFVYGVIFSAIIAIFLTFIAWEFLWDQNLIKDGFFNDAFLAIVLFIIVINLFFIIKFLFLNPTPNKGSSRVIVGSKGNNKIPVSLNDAAYIALRNGIVYLVTFSNDQIILPQNMEFYEKSLSEETFFRANRQFIVHRQACKSFNSAINGKVEIFVTSATTKVVVSQKRAAGFRTWIHN